MPDQQSERFSPAHLKHLELIQAVITRLSNSGSLVKGWAITLAGIFFGLAVNAKEPALAIVSVVPTLAFYWLDIYYLRSERLFRLYYDRARRGEASYEMLNMDATDRGSLESLTDDQRTSVGWSEIAKRPTLRPLYLGLLIAAVLVAGITSAADGSRHSTGCDSTTHGLGKIAQRC